MTVRKITYKITVHLIGGGEITVSNILRQPKLRRIWRDKVFTTTDQTTGQVIIIPCTSIKMMRVSSVVGR
jgi:hypothetical protein